MMDHDFTEREFIIRYYGYADILGKIGGITASFRPLLAAAAPIFILFYLFTLSEIILNKNKLKFEKELTKVFKEFKEVLHESIYLQYLPHLDH